MGDDSLSSRSCQLPVVNCQMATGVAAVSSWQRNNLGVHWHVTSNRDDFLRIISE